VTQKLTVKGLGFGKLNGTRELVDTPALRGMIAKVPHLVRIVE
jgi:large subunit ribosomal protein L30